MADGLTKMYLILMLMLVCQSSSEEVIQSLPSSSSGLLQTVDACLGEESNATTSCQSGKTDITSKANVQRIITNVTIDALAQDGKIKIVHENTKDDGNIETEERKSFGGRNLKDNSAKEKESIEILHEKDESREIEVKTHKNSHVFEELGDKNNIEDTLDHLNHEIVVDKRASAVSTQTSSTPDKISAKYEKSNELVPDNVAEETIPRVTPNDDQNVNTVEPMTEAPETTTDGVTEGSNVNVVPTLVVKEDDDTNLIHKSTSIPKNVITRVAVQDCPCDIIKRVCDINCCCDNDCSAYERLVFSRCLPLPFVSASQHCFSKQLIYIKNSPFYISKHPDNSLLCIETENLRSKSNFTHLKPIEDMKTFAKVFDRRKHNVWSKAMPRVYNPYSLYRLPHNQSYKVGQPIWTMNSTSVEIFELPHHSMLSDECSSSHAISYLQDFTSDCKVHVAECSAQTLLSSTQYYKNFLILASTSFQNLTSVYNCSKQSCLQIEPFSCEGDQCSPMSEEILPYWNSVDNVCANVTESLHYIFKHNGTHGIIKVMLRFHFTNVTLGQGLRLKTKVSFEWYNSYDRAFHRSGNPGYRTRAPLISGTRLSFNISQEEQSISSIYLSPSPSDWITMLSFTPEGKCDDSHRRNLLFGINERVMCSLVFNQKDFTDCESLQQYVYKLLLGNIKYQDSSTYLASNGDPSIYNIDDWVPLLWTTLPSVHSLPSLPCGHLITGLNIKLLHAYFGEYANPHTKLIGALIETYTHSRLACSDLVCKLDLTWSVSFVHTFNTPFTKFPEPPVYEIKLPSNFFYPFLSSGNRIGVWSEKCAVLVGGLCFLVGRIMI